MTDYEGLHRKQLLRQIDELFSEIKALTDTVCKEYNSEDYDLRNCTDTQLEEFKLHLGRTICRLDHLTFRYHTSQSWKYLKAYQEADNAGQ
jgi:hypothetical protein